MLKAELIIFDLDGTLVDSQKDIVNSVNYVLRKVGMEEKPASEISGYIGTGIEDLIIRSLGEKNKAAFEKALGIFREYFREHCLDTTILYPNVKEILLYFKNTKKTVVTNRKTYSAARVLDAFGLRENFLQILGSDNVACMKPDPCPVDKMISFFNIVDRKSVLIVGDMDIDVITGKNAGIHTCAVTYGIGKKEDIERSSPDYIIDDIIRLKDIVAR